MYSFRPITVGTAVNNGMTAIWVMALAVNGSNIFAGTYQGGVFISTNNGTNWTAVNNGLKNTGVSAVSALVVDGSNLFAGIGYDASVSTGDGVFLSTDNGASWTQVNSGLTNTNVNSLAVSGTNLFAGTSGGVFLSENNGINWSEVSTGLTYTGVNSLAISGSNLFAGTWGGGVGTSNDGTSGHGVWCRSVKEMISSVRQVTNNIPKQFILADNYPNPFNPSTTIQFSLPKASFVILNIYNSLGQEVARLVTQQMNAGIYKTEWNAIGFSSGIYFYRLKAGSFTETKKLVLLK